MIVLSVCVINRSISWGVCKWFRMTFGHHHRSCYFDCCYSQRAKTENALSPAARTFVGYWVEYFVMYQVTVTCCSKWSRLQTTCLHPALSLLHLLAAVPEISLHFFFSHFFQVFFVCRVWPSCVHCSTCLKCCHNFSACVQCPRKFNFLLSWFVGYANASDGWCVKAMSPDGESIVTGAGDETLRFWNVFNKTRSTKVCFLWPILSALSSNWMWFGNWFSIYYRVELNNFLISSGCDHKLQFVFWLQLEYCSVVL